MSKLGKSFDEKVLEGDSGIAPENPLPPPLIEYQALIGPWADSLYEIHHSSYEYGGWGVTVEEAIAKHEAWGWRYPKGRAVFLWVNKKRLWTVLEEGDGEIF